MWVPVRAGPVLLSITLLASCSEPPTDAGPNGRWAGTAVQPSLIPSAADPNAAPINRIRSVTTRVSDNVVIDVTEVDVSPANESWEVTLAIPGLDDATEVMVFVYLINVSGGNESVEFSGRSDPVTLISGESVAPTVAIVRGPIANLFTTAVTITTASSTMGEGMSQTFSTEVRGQHGRAQRHRDHYSWRRSDRCFSGGLRGHRSEYRGRCPRGGHDLRPGRDRECGLRNPDADGHGWGGGLHVESCVGLGTLADRVELGRERRDHRYPDHARDVRFHDRGHERRIGMIQGDFEGSEGTKAVGLFGGHFQLVVQALYGGRRDGAARGAS